MMIWRRRRRRLWDWRPWKRPSTPSSSERRRRCDSNLYYVLGTFCQTCFLLCLEEQLNSKSLGPHRVHAKNVLSLFSLTIIQLQRERRLGLLGLIFFSLNHYESTKKSLRLRKLRFEKIFYGFVVAQRFHANALKRGQSGSSLIIDYIQFVKTSVDNLESQQTTF